MIRSVKQVSVTFILCASFLSSRGAALFSETNGLVSIEAEHFTARVEGADGHRFQAASDRLDLDVPLFGPARGSFLVAGPNDDQNLTMSFEGTPAPWVDYSFRISNPGQYRLWLRWAGWEEGSDSIYAQILELKDGPGGAVRDWYRYSLSGQNSTNFVWQGNAAPELSNGAGGEEPAIFTLTNGIYTLRLSQREDGVAVDAIVLQLTSKSEPAGIGPDESRVEGILITGQPRDQRAAPGASVTFSVMALSGLPLSYQWQVASNAGSAFVDIPGATNTSFTLPLVAQTDAGKLFRNVITAGGEPVLTSAATLEMDNSPPILQAVGIGPQPTQAVIVFDEPLESENATNLANYSITSEAGNIAIRNATLDPSGQRVSFETDPIAPGRTWRFEFTGLADLYGNVNTNPQSILLEVPASSPGAARVDFYRDIFPAGSNQLFAAVADLTNSAKFPDQADATIAWDQFGVPSGVRLGKNYGVRMSGALLPPVSGEYRFFLRSDGPAQLWLADGEDPAGGRLIAEQTACCDPFLDETGSDTNMPGLASLPVRLEAGKKYPFHALWTHRSGPDHFAVAWRTPFDPDPTDVRGLTPIPGAYLESSAFSTTYKILPLVQDVVTAPWQPVEFSIAAQALSAFGTNFVVQWQRSVSGLAFTNIPGAMGPVLHIPGAAPWDNGTRYRAVVQNGFSASLSSVATLTVLRQDTPPALLEARGSTQAVVLTFDRPLDIQSAIAATNYSLGSGVTVRSAALLTGTNEPAVVRLEIQGASSGQSSTLEIKGLKDVLGNEVAPGTEVEFVPYDIFEDFTSFFPDTWLAGAARLTSNGELQLTSPGRNQEGSAVLGQSYRGDVHDFTAAFRVFIGQASEAAGEGFSFCIAPDLATNALAVPLFAEEGAGSGLVVAFNTFESGGADGPAISLKWGDSGATFEFARTNISKRVLMNEAWTEVLVQVDGRGRITLEHGGIRFFDRVQIPHWKAMAGAQVGFGARTGAEYAAHRVDDVRVVLNSEYRQPAPELRIQRSNGALEIAWTGSGRLESTDDLNSGTWTVLAEESPAALQAAGQTRFFRVVR